MIDMAAMKVCPKCCPKLELADSWYLVLDMECVFCHVTLSYQNWQLHPVSILPHAGQRVTTDSA